MFYKIIAVAAAIIVALGMTGIINTKDKAAAAVYEPAAVSTAAENTQSQNSIPKDMQSIMEKYGDKNLINRMLNGDYSAMNKFMNNLSDKDYQAMINSMRENGYGAMADRMEAIGRDQMIKMHNAIGGAAGCAGVRTGANSYGMMGRSYN